MNDENNTKPKRTISFGFIISFLIVGALIAILMFSLFSNTSTPIKSTSQFVTALEENKITEIVSVTPKDSTVVVVKGKYKESSTSSSSPIGFTVNIEHYVFYEEEREFNVVRYNSVTNTDEEVMESMTIHQYILYLEGTGNIVIGYDVKDAYKIIKQIYEEED